MRQFAGFDDFFPFYVGEHSRPATRWLHFAGSQVGLAAAIAGVVRRRPALVAAFPVVAYGVAWFSHAVVERNRPATFRHPLWSLRGDWTMIGMMWQGRDAELTRMAREQRITVLRGAA